MEKEVINLLWFKRDLRLSDHKPLERVINSEHKTYCFFSFEPIVENNYDFDLRHWQYCYQSLNEMKKKIPIHLLNKNIHEVIEALEKNYKINYVYSHEETGNDTTFKRDIYLRRLFKKKSIKWIEDQNNGVVRGLRDRKQWDAKWAKYVNTPSIKNRINQEKFIQIKSELTLDKNLEDKLLDKKWEDAGEFKAKEVLDLFLTEKVENYFKNISYPDKSRYHCSLLSANISWGNISIREIYQACKERRNQVKNKMSIDQFMARLKWHCHFIQKLEMEPRIEFENLNPSFNNIRQKSDKKKIKAWKNGLNGYPLVDAAMRCVEETGYLNFRLRSLVVSFLTHHLWQPWQDGAKYLAKCFIDYEPGIHFSQFQMQAGTTGINTIRIYNPLKQSLEKDKKAIFIKEWVPELAKLPEELIHEPWNISAMEEMMYDFKYGEDYPKRIVNHETASAKAREKLWSIKSSEENRLNSRKVLKKHTRQTKRKKYARR